MAWELTFGRSHVKGEDRSPSTRPWAVAETSRSSSSFQTPHFLHMLPPNFRYTGWSPRYLILTRPQNEPKLPLCSDHRSRTAPSRWKPGCHVPPRALSAHVHSGAKLSLQSAHSSPFSRTQPEWGPHRWPWALSLVSQPPPPSTLPAARVILSYSVFN